MKTQPSNCKTEVIFLLLVAMIMSYAYAGNNFCSTRLITTSDSVLACNGHPFSMVNIKMKNFVKYSGKENDTLPGSGVSKHPRLKLLLGFGFPELVYVRLQSYRNTFQFGAGAGTLPGYDHSIFSAFIQGGYHFGGKAKYNLIPPWYAKTLLGYGYEESSTTTWYSVFLSPRIGRNFYFGKKTGIDFEMGISFEIWEIKVERYPSDWNFDFDFPVVPTISFGFFYLTGK